ncbi:V-type ATP synthase subunit I [Jannaschia marina]|uniref:V-type ATP synthase subunit I n=1 Tax=Jannaschia marina TaxID=2741674 RepID=UPI0015C99786|nr:V-type ATP synthase subunit I [Jannaschia marina]
MSIARMLKVTLAGKAVRKVEVLRQLQDLGCMHLIPVSAAEVPPEAAPVRGAEEATKALRFLAQVAGDRRQVRHDPEWDATTFVGRVLDLRQRMRAARDRRDVLAEQIAEVRPWGEIDFGPAHRPGAPRLWFYRLPVRERAALDALDLPWEVVASDQRFDYVAVIAPQAPPADLLPVARVRMGSRPLSALERDLEEAELSLERLQDERLALTRYLDLLRADMGAAESRAELDFAAYQTRDADRLFAAQGWVPADDMPAVEACAEAEGLATIVEEPAWNEVPPTKLEQPPEAAAGVSLAMFYQVPSAIDWDPTRILTWSFALFFAMIVADAGYGLLLLCGLLIGWRRLDRSTALRGWRRLGFVVAVATVLYGALVGSYFGVAPDPASPLGAFAVLSLDDFDTMMRLSIGVGVAHLVFALAMSAWVHRDRRSAIARLGWIAAILGGLVLWLGDRDGGLATLGTGLLAGGLVAVAGFASDRPVAAPSDWAWRAVDGLRALSGAMGLFGDVLSYMRLFALGLASASLALTFNDLAAQVRDAVPGVGLLLALLILALGHVLNFGLALMSGVVHGLRLNYIEFFKWGLPEEGTAFRPLARKEVQE